MKSRILFLSCLLGIVALCVSLPGSEFNYERPEDRQVSEQDFDDGVTADDYLDANRMEEFEDNSDIMARRSPMDDMYDMGAVHRPWWFFRTKSPAPKKSIIEREIDMLNQRRQQADAQIAKHAAAIERANAASAAAAKARLEAEAEGKKQAAAEAEAHKETGILERKRQEAQELVNRLAAEIVRKQSQSKSVALQKLYEAKKEALKKAAAGR